MNIGKLSDRAVHDEYEAARESGMLETRKLAAGELLRRGSERWGMGVCIEWDSEDGRSTLGLVVGSPAEAEHGPLSGLRLHP